MKATNPYRRVMYACFARSRTARLICWAAVAGEETRSHLATVDKGRSVFNIAVSTAPGCTLGDGDCESALPRQISQAIEAHRLKAFDAASAARHRY